MGPAGIGYRASHGHCPSPVTAKGRWVDDGAADGKSAAAQERQAFMGQLRDIAQNMRNKASEAYGACIERAAELDVFDPIVAKAEKRLADLSAKTKTEVKEFVHDPVYIDDSVGKGELL